MTTIKPIDTIYNGYRFRSRLEARWAVFFDALGVAYEYEKEGYDLGDGIYYLPDFYIPEQPLMTECWVEVKGKERLDVADKEKCRRLAVGSATAVFIVHECTPFKPVASYHVESGIDIPDFDVEGSYQFITPDGYFDGLITLGWCPVCNKYKFGMWGTLCDIFAYGQESKMQQSYCKGPMTTAPDHIGLTAAFTKAKQARFEHGERGGPRGVRP